MKSSVKLNVDAVTAPLTQFTSVPLELLFFALFRLSRILRLRFAKIKKKRRPKREFLLKQIPGTLES